MTITSFRLQDDLATSLEKSAKELDRSKTWVINEALRSYFQNQTIEKKRWLETLDALESVKAGDVVDGDKVMDWIKSWGTENEKEPPMA